MLPSTLENALSTVYASSTMHNFTDKTKQILTVQINNYTRVRKQLVMLVALGIELPKNSTFIVLITQQTRVLISKNWRQNFR